MKLLIDTLQALFEILIFLNQSFLIGLKVIDEELVKLIFTVGQNHSGTIIFYFLNFLKLIFNLPFVDYFIFYFLLQLRDYLLILSGLGFVLILFTRYLLKLFIRFLFLSFYLLPSFSK
jgi:hypothetical protein